MQEGTDYGGDGEYAGQLDITNIQKHPSTVINYKDTKVSKSYKCYDETMNDSDCSEDYDNDPYF